MTLTVTAKYANADVSKISSIPLYPLGTEVEVSDKSGHITTYKYVQANATAAVAYEAALISPANVLTTGLTTTNAGASPQSVGVPQIAITGAYYGWVAVKGYMTVKCAASCAQDVALYTTATAGVVDDSATTKVQGLMLITTITTAAAAACNATSYLTVN